MATSSIVDSPEPSVSCDAAAEQLGDDADLAGALLEAAHADDPGRDDLAGADRDDAADGEEHAAAAGDLDDHADHARRRGAAVDDDDVADAAEAVAGAVEHRAPRQAGHEDARRTHGPRVGRPGRPIRAGRRRPFMAPRRGSTMDPRSER